MSTKVCAGDGDENDAGNVKIQGLTAGCSRLWWNLV